MSKEIDFLTAKTEEELWNKIKSVIQQKDKRYIKQIAANVVSLSHIEFKGLTLEDIRANIFSSQTAGSSKRLVLTNCIFHKSVDFYEARGFNEIKIEKCLFNDKVSIHIRPISTLILDNCTFNNGLYFKEVIISKDSKLFIFKHSTVKSVLQIKDSSLEYAKFHSINLENAIIEISDTNLTGIHFSNIKWGKRFKCDRDTFRQLKAVMEQHRNHIDANFFHGLELNEYRKELFSTYITKSLDKKLLFGLNWLISGFSTSWVRPLFILLIFSLLVYCYICYEGYILTCDVNGFFEFFNPFNKSSNEQYAKIYWLWFLHKIVSAFLIYHFVVALKKSSRF